LDDYWASDAEGLAESTFCPSDYKLTPEPAKATYKLRSS